MALLLTFELTLEAKAQSGLRRPPRRLALLVGISKYPQNGPHPWPTLQTEQDVEEVQKGLLAYGFPEDDIVVLRDHQATGSAIRDAFRDHLIRKAKPGDVVVFYFAGHGQQLPDDNNDEVDGLDESLVPYDARDQRKSSGAHTNLRDDELGAWLDSLGQIMHSGGHLEGNITVILDTCFSGTATRAGSGGRGRGWDVSLDGPRPPQNPAARADDRIGLLAEGQAAAQEYVLLAAAQSDQIANERGGRGVFTKALMHALMDPHTAPQTTYRVLIDRIAGEVIAEVADQVPQAEGAIDQQLFSGLAQPQRQRERAVRATVQLSGTLYLPLGKVHGATLGSVFSLYSWDAATFNAKAQLATAQLIHIEPFGASAQLIGPPGIASQLPRDLLAVEVAHRYEDSPLRVQAVGLNGIPAVDQALRKLEVVTTAGVNAKDYDVQVRYDPRKQAIELRRAGQERPIATLAMRPTVQEDLVLALAGLWRARFLTLLQNGNPHASVEARFLQTTPDTVRPDRKCTATPRAGAASAAHMLVYPGDCVQFEIINRSGRSVYFSVIEIDQSGEIIQQIPCDGCGSDNRLSADTQPVRYPRGFYVSARPGERSLWKVIITSQFVDFRTLSFSPARQRISATYVEPRFQPLVSLLHNVWDGRRAPGEQPGAISQQDWGTAEAILEVVAPPIGAVPARPAPGATPAGAPLGPP